MEMPLKESEILIKAFKLEAQRKPDERIFIGFKTYTYKEFSSLLDNHQKLDKETKKLIQSFLNQALKMFRENEEFRNRMKMLAGVK